MKYEQSLNWHESVVYVFTPHTKIIFDQSDSGSLSYQSEIWLRAMYESHIYFRQSFFQWAGHIVEPMNFPSP